MESAAPASAQGGSSATPAIDTPDLAIFEDATIGLPPPEARTLGDLAGRLPALEILARRHGEAVARLLAGAMQVESGLPGEEHLEPRPVDFARWRRDHTPARPAHAAWQDRGFAARSESIDPALENPFENVFPLRSMGARESVISSGAANSVQPQSASATAMVSQPSPHAATATPEPVSGTSGVDVASRIEKFHAVVTRVAHAIVRTADSGGGTAIVRLHPANLGRIQIEVTVEQQVAAVQLAVENPQVRQAMAQDGWMLRDSLAQQGLTLGEFSVRGDAAGAAPFGNRDAATSDRSTRGERSAREANVQTAPTPRRDLRASRVSMTI
ncbi:MAG: flagellar hook-length control protein FliK [Deltaproteobacteria bacterium]|nr:flagellar hook-length control protein FliK [Deltaproteobacteria bacterium]